MKGRYVLNGNVVIYMNRKFKYLADYCREATDTVKFDKSVTGRQLTLADSSRKHVREMYTPYTPLLHRITGVCMGIPFFLIFARRF